jgi:ferrous iron transport protein A
MVLAALQPGQRFRVIQVAFGGEIGKRLADLGFVPGVEGEVVRSAFFRGPMQVRLRDYDLIMRRHEARLVQVELLPAESQMPSSVPETTETSSVPMQAAPKPVFDMRPAALIRKLGGRGMRHGHGGRNGCCR